MSSGEKRVVFNTRERLISPDLNRLQKFIAQQHADVLKMLMLPVVATPDYGAGASLIVESSITSPAGGVVVDGLMVVVPTGSTELAVTSGAVLFLDPDGLTGSTVSDPANPDESAAKLCFSDAVLAGSGTLVLTPNASGSVRVDVIECQRNPNVVLETDNRDFFDQSTGLFVPSAVEKVMEDQVEFRIRLGTPGAGPPANAQGWMPLAVAVIANGATTWDQAIFYDVRPLARENATFPTLYATTLPQRRSRFQTDFSTVAGERRVSGLIETTFNGWRAGGVLMSRVGSSDVSYIDLASASYQEPGIVLSVQGLAYLWAAFPLGLPRWVRYTTIAIAPYSGRVPLGMRGIPIITHKAPFDDGGRVPSGALALPPGAGFDAGSTSSAVLLAGIAFDNLGTNLAPVADDGRIMVFGLGTAPVASTFTKTITPPSANTALIDYYDLTAGTHYPPGAKAVRVTVTTEFTGAASAAIHYYKTAHLFLEGGTTQIMASGPNERSAAELTTPGGTFTATFQFEIPVRPYAESTVSRIAVFWNQLLASGGALTKNVAASSLIINGWRL